MAAAIALGANGVQVGSRFVTTHESSAHINFKNAILNSLEGDTKLSLKQLTPVRLLKNEFSLQVNELENQGASIEELTNLLGRGRAKKGMFEGDLVNGELEIGQIASQLKSLQSAKEVIDDMVMEYNNTLKRLQEQFI
jgi:enoyl-[acyl-carrier protein] reductase II